jgi:hypothetical protein
MEDAGAAPPEDCNRGGTGRLEDSCGTRMPEAAAPCNDYSLCIYKIQCNEWETCQADCGTSVQRRDCWCWRSDGAVDVPMSECDAYGVDVEPTERECQSYEACSYMWHVQTDRTPFGSGACADVEGLIREETQDSMPHLDACEALCLGSKHRCEFYSYNAGTGRCELFSACERLSEVEPGFKTYKLRYAAEAKASQWRVTHGAPLPGCWGVCELELFSDEGCTQRLEGEPISSGARNEESGAAKAFDGNDWCGDRVAWGQWSSTCGLPGAPVPAGTEWIGLDFGEEPVLVKCVRLKQSGAGAPDAVTVQSYDGHSWFDRWDAHAEGAPPAGPKMGRARGVQVAAAPAEPVFTASAASTAACFADHARPSPRCRGALGTEGCRAAGDCAAGLECEAGGALFLHGTAGGLPVCTDGRLMSMDFRGDGLNFVRLDASTVALNAEFVANLWIKPLSPEAEGRILSKPRADGGTGWSVQIENGMVEFVGVGEPVQFWGTGKASVQAGRWTMVTAVFSQQRRQLWLNGELRQTDPSGPTTALTTASEDSPILIGREFLSDYQGGRPLKYVRVAKVAVWSRALDGDDVAALFAGGDPRDIKARYLVGSWASVRDVESETDPARNFVKSVPLAASEDFPGRPKSVRLDSDLGIGEKRRVGERTTAARDAGWQDA